MDSNSSKTTTSAALLTHGNSTRFSEKFLLRPCRPQTELVPRSSVLERLQNFLPQMEAANQKLQREMEAGSAEQFDIENVDEAPSVIEMDVALVELDESGSSSEEEEETEEETDSDSSGDGKTEVTENNLRLPGHRGSRAQRQRRAQIQVLQEESTETDQSAETGEHDAMKTSEELKSVSRWQKSKQTV